MATLTLSARQRAELESLVAHTSLAQERSRAQASLGLAEGPAVAEVADLLGVSRPTVSNGADRGRRRDGFGLRQRLRDAPRSGRPPTASGVIDPGSPRGSTRTRAASAITPAWGPPRS